MTHYVHNDRSNLPGVLHNIERLGTDHLVLYNF